MRRGRTLLDLLEEVVVVQDLIIRPMPQLHARPASRIPRIASANSIAPRLRRLTALPRRALRIPHAGPREAAVGHTGKGGAGGEKVRVRARQHVRHHGAGAGAGHEDAGGVGAVLLDRVADHACDAEGVAAGIVRQSRGAVDVPAVAGVGGVGVDDDEAVLVGERGVAGTGVVGLGGAAAVVHRDDDVGVALEGVGHVDVHLGAGGVGAEVGDLRQRGSQDAAGEGEEGDEREMHLDGDLVRLGEG